MIEIYKKINLNEIKAKMLLQVHDELVFEVEEIYQDIVISKVIRDNGNNSPKV